MTTTHKPRSNCPCPPVIECNVPDAPTTLGQRWACPECGKVWRSFDPNLDPKLARTKRPFGLGWRHP